MPKISYDVIIVGSGPAGIFAANELIKKNPKLKVALIEMGSSLKKRSPKEIMSGFGGAGTYSDGKLHYTAKLSHERTFHLLSEQKYTKILEYVDKTFRDFGVDSDYYPKGDTAVEKMLEEAQKNNVELILRRTQHVGTDNLKKVMANFEKHLVNNNIHILYKTKIADILVAGNKCIGVIDTKKKKYFAKKILLAPGRISTKWLQDLAINHKIAFDYGMVEIGVRVEFPESIMKHHAETLYEIVYKVRTKKYDDIVRTFCSCPNGYVTTENYYGLVCVNGHSDSKHNAPNSNFAFVCEVNLTEPVENTLDYAKAITQMATTLGGGKPILQRLADLRKGRRSTWGRINKSIIKPSLTDVTPGDISMALPHRIVTNIIEGLEILDKVMPGVNSGSTLLYAPEAKFRSSFIDTTKKMETSLKNLHVAGDASGLSGTITGAAATGIMAARGIASALK